MTRNIWYVYSNSSIPGTWYTDSSLLLYQWPWYTGGLHLRNILLKAGVFLSSHPGLLSSPPTVASVAKKMYMPSEAGTNEMLACS